MGERKEAYLIYLASPEWQQKREQVFKSRGKKCQVCKSTDHIEVHHTSYTHLGFEPLKDLVILCKECHKKVHQLGGGRKGLKKLKDPKWQARAEKKKKERQLRKTFIIRMKSGPVKTFTKEEIAEANQRLNQQTSEIAHQI